MRPPCCSRTIPVPGTRQEFSAGAPSRPLLRKLSSHLSTPISLSHRRLPRRASDSTRRRDTFVIGRLSVIGQQAKNSLPGRTDPVGQTSHWPRLSRLPPALTGSPAAGAGLPGQHRRSRADRRGSPSAAESLRPVKKKFERALFSQDEPSKGFVPTLRSRVGKKRLDSWTRWASAPN